jgi:hypothetical protein
MQRLILLTQLFSLVLLLSANVSARGTGDLGIVIERATGSIQVIETTTNSSLGRIEGLGDLSHASAVYSRDEQYAYIFGRDGGLTKIDIINKKIIKRVMQSGNSIGGAISQDGRLVAVSNYKPGGVKIFDANTLDLVADIPANYAKGQQSKVIGLVDAPGQKFVFSLWDAGEIWVADMSDTVAVIISPGCLVKTVWHCWIYGTLMLASNVFLMVMAKANKNYRCIRCHTLKAGPLPAILPLCLPSVIMKYWLSTCLTGLKPDA